MELLGGKSGLGLVVIARLHVLINIIFASLRIALHPLLHMDDVIELVGLVCVVFDRFREIEAFTLISRRARVGNSIRKLLLTLPESLFCGPCLFGRIFADSNERIARISDKARFLVGFQGFRTLLYLLLTLLILVVASNND